MNGSISPRRNGSILWHVSFHPTAANPLPFGVSPLCRRNNMNKTASLLFALHVTNKLPGTASAKCCNISQVGRIQGPYPLWGCNSLVEERWTKYHHPLFSPVPTSSRSPWSMRHQPLLGTALWAIRLVGDIHHMEQGQQPGNPFWIAQLK